MFNAKHLPSWARKCCQVLHMTPRRFQVVMTDGWDMLNDNVVVLRVSNARRSLDLTAGDYRYSSRYFA